MQFNRFTTFGLTLILILSTKLVYADIGNDQFIAAEGPVYSHIGGTNKRGVEPSFEVSYLHTFSPTFGYALSYINEAHFPGNLRDGFAPQLIALTPGLIENNLKLDAAIGPYFYANTQFDPDTTGNIYQNIHRIGVVYSAGATLSSFDPFLINLTFNHIQAKTFNTNAILLGAGIDLDALSHPDHKASHQTGHQQINLLLGRSGINGRATVYRLAEALQYHYLFNSNFETSGAYIHEGKSDSLNRQGIAAMGWLTNRFADNRLMLEIGAGPYFTRNDHHDSLAGLVGGGADYYLSEHISVHGEWDRVVTNNNTDSDLFLGGIGINF